MKISKNERMALVAMLIVLAVYNVIAFVLPFQRGGMFWTGYGFAMAALFLAIGVGAYVLGHNGLRSKVYGWPLLTLVWRYLIVQLVVGLAEMALPVIPFQYGIVLNVILLGACLIGLIVTDIGKRHIEHIDKKVKEKVLYVSWLRADVEGLVNQAADEDAKNALKGLAEDIRCSDPMSKSELAAIEGKIEAKVAALATAVAAADADGIKALCEEARQLIDERNRKCKILK